MGCQDDHVLDYLNEDGLSVEPRGFSQSGLSQHASKGGGNRLHPEKILKSSIALEIHKSRVFLCFFFEVGIVPSSRWSW